MINEEFKNSLENDKKSISTVFKSKSDVEGLADKLNTRETEIEYQIKLADLLTVYQGVTCQAYKKEKLATYKKVLGKFAVQEMENSHK